MIMGSGDAGHADPIEEGLVIKAVTNVGFLTRDVVLIPNDSCGLMPRLDSRDKNLL